MAPRMVTEAPSVTVMNNGRSAWMISLDRSISRLTKPSTQTVRGRRGRLMRPAFRQTRGGASLVRSAGDPGAQTPGQRRPRRHEAGVTGQRRSWLLLGVVQFEVLGHARPQG